MKSIILTVIASFAALTAAQSLSSLPQCAVSALFRGELCSYVCDQLTLFYKQQSCVTGSFGGCSALDVKCICADTNLISQLSCCVATKCPPADQQSKFIPLGLQSVSQAADVGIGVATIKFASQLCAAYVILSVRWVKIAFGFWAR